MGWAKRAEFNSCRLKIHPKRAKPKKLPKTMKVGELHKKGLHLHFIQAGNKCQLIWYGQWLLCSMHHSDGSFWSMIGRHIYERKLKKHKQTKRKKMGMLKNKQTQWPLSDINLWKPNDFCACLWEIDTVNDNPVSYCWPFCIYGWKKRKRGSLVHFHLCYYVQLRF